MESLDRPSFDPTLLTTEFLSNKRAITDPLADDLIAKLIDSGNKKLINEVFLRLTTNASYSIKLFEDFPEGIKDSINQYFETTSKLPEWADQNLIAKGQEVFSIYGPEVFMLLNVSSLPMCYTCAKGAKVLYATGRLMEKRGNIDPLARRLMETAQMVMNVMSPGGFAEKGSGLVTMQKVRLIHASIRHYLKSPDSNPNGWNVDSLGEPINQEDLAGTLMSFAPIIANGLTKLKINLAPDQLAGYMHCWQIVGHQMGVSYDLIPKNNDDATKLAVAILKHQADTSEEGKALTTSCIDFMNYIIPGNHFENVPEYMMWYFFQDIENEVGKPLSEMVGIESHDDKKDRFIMLLTRLITKEISHLEHHELIKKLTSFFNRYLLRGFVKYYNDNKNVHFFIPPSLQKNWGLFDEWEDKKAVTPSVLGNRLMWQQKSGKLK